MQAALHSYSFRDRFDKDPAFDIFQALDITAEMGFHGIEIMTGMAGSKPTHIGSDDLAHLEKVKNHAEKRGITIQCFSTYNDFAFVKNEEWRLANIEYVKRWLQLAGDVGVPNIRMLTGYYNDDAPKERLEQLTRDGIRECLSIAEAAGVNMALENHNSIFFSGPDILALQADMGSPRLTACPDPSNWSPHFFESDCPESEREGVYQNLALLAPQATQSHLKIQGITKDGRLEGFDLTRLVNLYRDAGYEGALAFESIVPGDDLLAPLPQAREIVEAAIAGKKET